MHPVKDPLSPLAGWINFLLPVVAVMIAYGLYGFLTGDTVTGLGSAGNVCVQEPSSSSVQPDERFLPHDVRVGVDMYVATSYTYCTANPDLEQRAWHALTVLPSAALFGLLTFSRFVQVGAHLRADLDGTV